MSNGRNYIGEARKKLESGDVDTTFLILAEGIKNQDEKSMMALYYMPKPEDIKWNAKVQYFMKNFFQFDLAITFDDFKDEVGPIGRWELFEQCARELGTTKEELRTGDYYNWCLEHKYKVSKKQIDLFWDKATKEILRSDLLSLLTNLENMNI